MFVYLNIRVFNVVVSGFAFKKNRHLTAIMKIDIKSKN